MADFVDEMFRTAEEGADPTPEPEQPVETPAEPQAEPEPTPEPEPAPTPEPEPETPKDERAIPLATALQWRDEAKANRRRVEELEASRRQQETQPDPFDDPQGFAAFQTQQVGQMLTEQRFAMSDMFARQQHGDDTVNSAVEWAQERAQKDPIFAQSYMGQQNPINWIVQQHKRDAMLSDIGDNVDDWFTREAAKRGYAPQDATVTASAVAPVQPAPKPAVPPRSIASDATPSANAPADPAAFWSFLDRK